MDIIPITITPEQETNLRTLADFLIEHVDEHKFNMASYNVLRHDSFRSVDPEVITSKYNECGTVACAAGHGPIAGIHAMPGELWNEYTERVFGTSFYNRNGSLFVWLFDSLWQVNDNTPEGAAKRIYFYLEHKGIPKNFYEQELGEAPLSYA